MQDASTILTPENSTPGCVCECVCEHVYVRDALWGCISVGGVRTISVQ